MTAHFKSGQCIIKLFLGSFFDFWKQMQYFFQALDSCACKAIFGQVKPATAGPVTDTYLELKMLYFILP